MYELTPDQTRLVAGGVCEVGCSLLKSWAMVVTYEAAKIIGSATYTEASGFASGPAPSGNLGYLVDGSDSMFEEDNALASGY